VPVDLDRVAARVEPEDRRAAGGGADEVEQGSDRGGLAGAVRAQVAEDLAALDGKRQVDDAARVRTTW
jgi:hypothetical protein